jgi:hypothetical protein
MLREMIKFFDFFRKKIRKMKQENQKTQKVNPGRGIPKETKGLQI